MSVIVEEMDRKKQVLMSSSVQEQRKMKKKKKGIRVVYISNPMRVEASASQFRSLVQELTGRDSDHSIHLYSSQQQQQHHHHHLSPPPSPLAPHHHEHGKLMPPTTTASHHDPAAAAANLKEFGCCESPSSYSYQLFDDVFLPQMTMESFPGHYSSCPQPIL